MKNLPNKEINNSKPQAGLLFQFVNCKLKIENSWRSQSGFAPAVLLAFSGVVLAVVITLVATRGTIFPSSSTITPSPSQKVSGDLNMPVYDGVIDTEICDDEYNADCESEGDDVDPSDLAGPD